MDPSAALVPYSAERYSGLTRGLKVPSLREFARPGGSALKLINPNPFTTRPEIVGTFGVVASTHWIATAVGMGILERGGNAFDAAVATAFTLQVVEPHLCGPGGDAPLIFHAVKKGKTEVMCGQGVMPAKATIAHFKGLGLDLIPGTGLLPAAVPGTFDAYMLMLRDYGTMRVGRRAGARHRLLHERPSAGRARLGDHRHGEGQFPRQLADLGRGLSAGQQGAGAGLAVPQHRPSATPISRILKEAEAGGGGREAEIERARKVWSQGFVAEAIDRFYTHQEIMDVSGQRNKGLLRGDDMAKWQATVEEPLTYDYGRYTVCKAGPWAQSPVTLQQLALLKGFNLDGADPTSADFIHTVVEASKLAFADREAFYGDPKFVDVPMQTLLSDAYNADRRKLIDPAKASLDQRPGKVEGYGGVVKLRRADGSRAAVAASGAGEPTVGRMGQMSGDTVHFDIVDKDGNMVSATPSGGWLHGSPVVPGARLPDRHARPDLLARGRPALVAGAGQAAAHDADAHPRPSRRRAVHGLGFAGRRPAGAVDHADVPAPCPLRHEPAGGDRRAGLAQRALPLLVLAAHGASGRAGAGRPHAGRNGPGIA